MVALRVELASGPGFRIRRNPSGRAWIRTQDDVRRCQPHNLLAVTERDAVPALQRNAAQSASALTNRAFKVATRWVYRLRQASAALGQF